jgi:TolB-like protein/DNA-binding winged helix-turn-helix (wHTH) protein/Flp pilus assembly protein TadD
MSLVGNAIFHLGQWRVDPALDEISRDGQTVKLEPRTMRVLVCLAERPGEVVSVNQLLDVVWKDLVVTPYSVYQAVAALRRAFGDDSRNPTYIANIARRGYRLIAPVEMNPPAANLVRAPAAPAAGSDAEEPRVLPKDTLSELAPHSSARGQIAKLRIGVPYAWLLIVLLAVAGSALWLTSRLSQQHGAPVTAGAANGAASPTSRPAAPFNPPARSIAVLPFLNLSGDPSQQYFSDGLTEEVLNSLTRVIELQVAARTSSFSFQGEHPDIATVAHKLNVESVLEGSVRRSGNTIRVTVQLNDAVTGFHLWSQTYDRELGDVLKLQADIADAVAGALKVTLLGDTPAKIELGGTHNAAAFDAYLRGAQAARSANQVKDRQVAIEAYTEAIRLDPKYALAFAGRSRLYTAYATSDATGAAIRESFDRAEADARQAIRLAPELAEGYVALGHFYSDGALDFTQARGAIERSLALAPGDATVQRLSGKVLAYLGQFDESISAARRAVTLDPLNRRSHNQLGESLFYARRYREAIRAFGDAIALDPNFQEAYGHRGVAYYALGDLSSARSSCETKPNIWMSQQCLAIVYEKLGRGADAEAVLAKMRAVYGDAAVYQYSTIYAQWGNRERALEWLATAMRLRDPGLVNLKTDPLMDPLRREPRFQAVERELKFPN